MDWFFESLTTDKQRGRVYSSTFNIFTVSRDVSSSKFHPPSPFQDTGGFNAQAIIQYFSRLNNHIKGFKTHELNWWPIHHIMNSHFWKAVFSKFPRPGAYCLLSLNQEYKKPENVCSHCKKDKKGRKVDGWRI